MSQNLDEILNKYKNNQITVDEAINQLSAINQDIDYQLAINNLNVANEGLVNALKSKTQDWDWSFLDPPDPFINASKYDEDLSPNVEGAPVVNIKPKAQKVPKVKNSINYSKIEEYYINSHVISGRGFSKAGLTGLTAGISGLDAYLTSQLPREEYHLSLKENFDISSNTSVPSIMSPWLSWLIDTPGNLLAGYNALKAINEARIVKEYYNSLGESASKKWLYWKKLIKTGLCALPAILSKTLGSHYGARDIEVNDSLYEGTINNDYAIKALISLGGLGLSGAITLYESKRNIMKSFDEFYNKQLTEFNKLITLDDGELNGLAKLVYTKLSISPDSEYANILNQINASFKNDLITKIKEYQNG